MPKKIPTATMERTMKRGRSRKNGRTRLERISGVPGNFVPEVQQIQLRT